MKKLFQWLIAFASATLLLLAGAQTNNYNTLDSLATATDANRIAVNLGGVPGYTRVAILGHNPSIGNGAAADVWEGGGNYPFSAAAANLEVVSASANDTAAGTGARTVTIIGLDSNYNQITEVVTLNGTTPVSTVNQFLRVNLFTTTSSGSGQVNAGDLTLRVAGAGATQSIARAGYGFGRQAVYTVPNGFTLYAGSFNFSVATPNNSLNSAVFGIQQTSATGNKRIPVEFQVTSNQSYLHFTQFGLSFAAKTDIVLRVTNTAQMATNVMANAEGILVANGQLRK